jgi:hypothetical protein
VITHGRIGVITEDIGNSQGNGRAGGRYFPGTPLVATLARLLVRRAGITSYRHPARPRPLSEWRVIRPELPLLRDVDKPSTERQTLQSLNSSVLSGQTIGTNRVCCKA